MPLTKEQLLIPRVMCVGTEPGTPNDTSGLYRSGEIYTYEKCRDGSEWYKNNANTLAMPIAFLTKFPHLFRPMPWWEGRKPEDMPEYVNTNSVYGIRKVKEWAFIKGKELEHWRVEDTRGEIYGTLFFDLTPATEQEYNEYQKQKEG